MKGEITVEMVKAALDSVVKIQCSDGNWDYDPYMHGMANGLLLAQSLFHSERVEFLKAPKVWGCDKPGNRAILGEEEHS